MDSLDLEDGPRDAAGDAFWRFSLSLYARPGARGACLGFQDQGGGDVNLLLFFIWCGRAAGRLDEEEIETALALAERWRRRAVAPLREIRRDLKGGVEGFPTAERLRGEIKRLELVAEEIQQRALAPLALLATPLRGEASISLMLDAYLARLDAEGVGDPVAARRHVDTLRSIAASETVPNIET